MLTGMQAMQEAIKEGKATAAANLGGGFYNYFNWKNGDRKIVRFLTDDVITAEFAEWIFTNDGKTKNFLIDPAKGDLLAKHASANPGLGWRRNPKTQQLEERVLRKLSVGAAVLRDEVPDGKGGTTVIDHTYDIDVGGTNYPARWFGVVQQSHSNFWHQISGFFNRYSTITDRDYEISRSGTQFETKYQIVPLDPDEDLRDLANLQTFYGYGRPWPKKPEDGEKDPAVLEAYKERFMFCPMTLAQWADYFSGEDRVKHWLTPRANTPQSSGLDEFHQDTTHNSADEAQATMSGDTTFASLKEKLLKNK